MPISSGDSCGETGCAGVMVTYKTKVYERIQKRVRSLECDTCGNRPELNKMIIPLQYAPVQKARRKRQIRMVQKRLRF